MIKQTQMDVHAFYHLSFCVGNKSCKFAYCCSLCMPTELRYTVHLIYTLCLKPIDKYVMALMGNNGLITSYVHSTVCMSMCLNKLAVTYFCFLHCLMAFNKVALTLPPLVILAGNRHQSYCNY